MLRNLQADTLLTLYQVSARLVTLLKFIYSSTQVSNVLVPIVCCKIINFVFQIFPLFVPEMSTSFTSYIVPIISIYLELKESKLYLPDNLQRILQQQT
jgi:hypothetical protein